ncbi:MAG TPA: non-homologous end-joining DNA ligase [Candidatus Eisenbacteria bacterium]|nr:non-homologous end-joining DNA ligase [Candidatus Eisenbacteria bacterium]
MRFPAALTAAERGLARAAAQPRWMQPMLATLTGRRFSDADWIFEPKLDGVRCLAFRRDAEVELFSRNRIPARSAYPEIADALAREKQKRFVLDGEIVAFRDGLTSFEELQKRMKRDPGRERLAEVPVFYYVFDVLYLAGHDLTRLPLLSRKRILREAFALKAPLAYVTHVEKEGERYYREACSRRWEGLIAKRAASAYVARRSPDWLKFKCVNAQEFVIGGFTPPQGARAGFGALLLGYYEDGALRYAGKVGTGYDDRTLESLGRRLLSLRAASPPFDAASRGALPKTARWVRPLLVAEVAFTEWTRDGRLRHPSFKGLRRDKPAREVVREAPAARS